MCRYSCFIMKFTDESSYFIICTFCNHELSNSGVVSWTCCRRAVAMGAGGIGILVRQRGRWWLPAPLRAPPASVSAAGDV
jgi:hypothetical protein